MRSHTKRRLASIVYIGLGLLLGVVVAAHNLPPDLALAFCLGVIFAVLAISFFREGTYALVGSEYRLGACAILCGVSFGTLLFLSGVGQ